MPGYVIHLAIAEKYLEKNKNEKYNDFIDGVIYPDEINDKYKYQIQEDKKENLGGLKFSAYQVAKIAWLYEDWRS